MSEPHSPERMGEIVLEMTSAMLWRRDETEIRIADICRATGLSSSVIYNHFGSRQGLIDAAFIAMYAQSSAQMMDTMRAATAQMSDPEVFYQWFVDELDEQRRPFWLSLRQVRLRAASAAVARASLRAQFAIAQDQHLKDLASYLADLQERGLVGRHLSATRMARVFESYILGHTYNDIALNPVSNDEWLDTLWALLNPQLVHVPPMA